MSAPETLGELARWAHDEGLARLLQRPFDYVLDELCLDDDDERLLRTLCVTLRARSMLHALHDARTPGVLARLASPGGAAKLVDGLYAELSEHVDDDDDDDDLGERALAAPRTAAAIMPWIEAAPQGLAQARAWAAKHGVAERLSDPASVIAPRLYGTDRYTAPLLQGAACTVGDLLDPPSRVPPPNARASRWEIEARARSLGSLAMAARGYLHDVATRRAAVLAAREALARRARPPSEPCLIALAAKLEAARAELAPRVKARPIGTYHPQPARVEQAPLRIVYAESPDRELGVRGIHVVLAVEEEPLRAVCDCGEGDPGPCPHALDALDAALDLLRDPAGEAPALAAVLAVPVWRRFLRAFGDELTHRAPAPPEDVRLAWRIVGGGKAAVEVEPLLQKRLKGGGWSQGGRVRVDDVIGRRELLTDARDARALRAAELDEAGGSSRGSRRTIEALIGHPRVFLEGKPGTPVRVARERLRVALEVTPEAPEAGVAVSFQIGARRRTAAELLRVAGDGEQLVEVDPEAGSVALCALDERAVALLTAFAAHPARFPKESHDDLVRGLAPLQDSVDLALPEALAGEPVVGDARPVVRLSPRGSGEVDVDVVVRPIEGGPAFRPGEGPRAVLHALGGRRVSARRDLAEETSRAAALVERVASLVARVAPGREPEGEGASAWSFPLDEEATLDLLARLRELGEAVVVEWPEPDRRLSLASMVSRKELRIRVVDRRDWFGVEGEIEIDGAAVPLAALLDAVRLGKRYVRVGPGRFAEIEGELRQRVAAADDVLHAGKKGLEVALPGVAALEGLVDGVGHLEAAVRWRELVGRLDAARALDPALPAALTATLRPYQLEGFRWLMRLAAWGAGACLADDMGLGKTVQALAVLLARAELGPALVVAPTSVGPNWLREAERFAPTLRARMYRGPGRAAQLAEARPGDLFVTSYALAVRDAEALGQVRFGTLVLDEAQAIKNALTRRARAITGLDAELRVALTGTPIENHLGELWSLMRVLTPGLLGSWEHFRDRFATPIERSRDKKRSLALSRLVRPFLLRRTKAEVAPELPPRTEIERFVDLSAAERRLYDDARRAALETLAIGEGDARFAIFAALTRLRRLACHPRLLDDGSRVPSSKLAVLLELVDELREEGHRALVFSQFTSHLALVREALDRAGITYAYLDGATPSEERTRRIDAFQAGGADLFLISLKAGGTGLNLTAADYVIHLDPWWNPAVEDQATDRAHRIGQTKAVTVIRLVARGTIEEAVLGLHKDKRALAASVFDESGSPARLSAEELAALIRAGVTDASGDAPGDDEGDASGDDEGDELAPVGDEAPPRAAKIAPSVPAPALAPVPAPAPALETLVTQVIDWLAEQRGGIDPHYDPTLRTYERSLRRFTGYLAEGGATTAPTDEAIAAYLEAVNDGVRPVPASEKGVARTVMKHLRAFLRREQATPVAER